MNLRKNKKADWSAKQGFTLVELLLVMAIIGILAGVLFTMLSPARKKARVTAFKEAMKGMVSSASLCTDAGGTINPVAGSTFCTGTNVPNLKNSPSIRDCDGTGVAVTAASPASGDLWNITGTCHTGSSTSCAADCNSNGCQFTGDCN